MDLFNDIKATFARRRFALLWAERPGETSNQGSYKKRARYEAAGKTGSEAMKILGMRFCRVAKAPEAAGLADMLRKLGAPERQLEGMPANEATGFSGAVFPVADNEENSWIEVWPTAEGMPEMVMLQIIVDDADACAENARKNGLDPKGPDDAHGERIYYIAGPGGLPISFQSRTDG